MIVFGNRKFIQAAFSSEDELEQVVVQNTDYIFGPNSIYLPKALIRTHDGFGTIPDGFAIDIEAKQWFIVEAELSSHSVWNHIAPQVTKQLIAASNPATKQRLINLAVDQVKSNAEFLEKFSDLGILEIDVRKILGEILEGKPNVGMPIDFVSNDLKEWAATLKANVRLWIVRKLVEFGHPENFMYEFPEEFRPDLDIEDQSASGEAPNKAFYAITLAELIQKELIHPGDKLLMTYKPRNGDKKNYEGIVQEDGGIKVLGKVFSAPSYAALYAMENAGTTRTTVNGWVVWKTEDGKLLADLREEYIQKQNSLV